MPLSLKSSRNIKHFTGLFVLLSAFWLIQSCANVGMPSGGPKDSTPPLLIKSNPPNYSVNFNSTSIDLFFDEYIQAKNLKQQLIVSPPSSNPPVISIKGKKIHIELKDSLLQNTTYSINFGNAIVDNNEGNILQDLQFVFSTGAVLDSLQVSGKVSDALSGKALESALVMLYKDLSDSVPFRKVPYFVGRTNAKGEFKIRNISDTLYQLVALQDVNANYLYDSPDELIAFSDSLIRPSAFVIEKTDTIAGDSTRQDSVVHRFSTRFLPDSLHLNLFKEELKIRKIALKNRPTAQHLEVIFSLPHPEEISFSMAMADLNDQNSLHFFRPNRDSLSIWLLDSALYSADTLRLVLNYTKTDSLLSLVAQTDTLVYPYRQPAIQPAAKLSVVSSLKKQGTMEIDSPAIFSFDQPVADISTDKITFTQKQDSSFIPATFTVLRDSVNPLQIELQLDTEPGKAYRLLAEPGAFRSVYGWENDSLLFSFDYRKPDAYGKLILNTEQGDENWIIDLLTEKGVLVRSLQSGAKKTSTFDNLLPDKYILRVIRDANRNGKWDTGNLEQKKQAEKTFHPPGVIQVRANWDMEVEVKIPN